MVLRISFTFILMIYTSVFKDVKYAEARLSKSRYSFNLINDQLNKSEDSVRNKTSQQVGLPWGCKKLLQLPNNWKKDWIGDDTLIGKINNCYQEINKNIKGSIPDINAIDYIYFKDNVCSCYTKNIDTLVKQAVRLPDIGAFKVYYNYRSFDLVRGCMGFCSALGSLLLYNPQKKEVKVIPIYSEYDREAIPVIYTFFYIPNYDNITIYEIFVDEREGWINSKSKIAISNEGNVVYEKYFNKNNLDQQKK